MVDVQTGCEDHGKTGGLQAPWIRHQIKIAQDQWGVMKGYKLKDFEDSFQRYLVPDPGKEGLQVTNLSEGMETVAPA